LPAASDLPADADAPFAERAHPNTIGGKADDVNPPAARGASDQVTVIFKTPVHGP
jgi:hypothetical protein